jgi:hypothetical protein
MAAADHPWRSAIALALWLTLTPIVRPAMGTDQQENESLFVRRIAPVIEQKCLACHGRDTDLIEGGLDLRSLQSTLDGGDSGQAVISPGDAANSPLMMAIGRDDSAWSAMPPKDAERLSEAEISWFAEWIDGGAHWPTPDRIAEINAAYETAWAAEDGIAVQTSGGLSDQWTNRRYQPDALWAYQPVPENDPAAVQQLADWADQGIHPIDGFIAQRVPDGLIPAPPADRSTLIRRASFDLTGLPPTQQAVDQFLNDPQSDDLAFADVVESLLSSPHYGERMAQHWLDVVRYADSSGFANDYARGNAWRYRDYVIRSFNEDRPYDQFIRQQIAGDEIYATLQAQGALRESGADSELLVATGMLRMGPWELTGMEVPRVARQRFLDDVTNSVGETFLAQSLQCARCHDHKFDPVPTRDYYAIQAVFATTQLAERPAPFAPFENVTGFDQQRYLRKREHELKAILDSVQAKVTVEAGRKWLLDQGRETEEFDQAVAKTIASQNAKSESDIDLDLVRRRMQQAKVHPDLIPPAKAGFQPDDFGNERVARKGLERLGWELERYQPFALAVYSGRTPELKNVYRPLRIPADPMQQGELEPSCILVGGDPFSPGEPVDPGVLSVIDGQPPTVIPSTIEGRRTALADWIADSDNPLTTRTIVNRLWLWHFNQPLAGNPNNFGSTGKPPSHPELLDFLARSLVDSGWSLRDMHRLIMSSQAYRRSSEAPDPELLSRLDPTHTSYATFLPRRLTAEEIRDAMLAVTGELNLQLGGIPNHPEINLEAALQPRQVMGTFAAAWVPDPLPEQRHRRSIYATRLRGLANPMFDVFNAPAPDFSCERRETSTVTPQVFTLFNGRSSNQRALALADRVLRETDGDREAIQRCFELVFTRPATSAEIELCLEHWANIERTIPDQPPARVTPPKTIRRDAVEENTGERFSFEETLHANSDFVSDLQPADVDLHTRALSDICLVLMNSNEFVYVY